MAYGHAWNPATPIRRPDAPIPAYPMRHASERVSGLSWTRRACSTRTVPSPCSPLPPSRARRLRLWVTRAQLPAVGRGGVLDMAAQIRGRTIDMAEVHRFTDPAYAELSVRLRERNDPGKVFDQLAALGLIRLHADAEHLHEHIAPTRERWGGGHGRHQRRSRPPERAHPRPTTCWGGVDDAAPMTGSDGLPISCGDLIQTRKNDTILGVANRQLWIVHDVEVDGRWCGRPKEAVTANASTPCACLPRMSPGMRILLMLRPRTGCRASPPRGRTRPQ